MEKGLCANNYRTCALAMRSGTEFPAFTTDASEPEAA
jgi:hypothetical protein